MLRLGKCWSSFKSNYGNATQYRIHWELKMLLENIVACLIWCFISLSTFFSVLLGCFMGWTSTKQRMKCHGIDPVNYQIFAVSLTSYSFLASGEFCRLLITFENSLGSDLDDRMSVLICQSWSGSKLFDTLIVFLLTPFISIIYFLNKISVLLMLFLCMIITFFFENIFLGTPKVSNVLLGLIWVQAVCKSYQQTIKEVTSRLRVNWNYSWVKV